jgi:hypothetical protein
VKRPVKRREALEAMVAGSRRTLSNGFQAIKDLKTISAMAHVDSAKAKMMTMIVTHVEVDLGENTPQPPPGAPNVNGFRVARTWGTT